MIEKWRKGPPTNTTSKGDDPMEFLIIATLIFGPAAVIQLFGS